MEAVLIGGKELKKYKISCALTCFAIIIGIILIIKIPLTEHVSAMGHWGIIGY